MTQEFITIETMKPLRRGKQGMGTLSEDSTYIANGLGFCGTRYW